MRMLNGKEKFLLDGKNTGLNVNSFWSFCFSNLMDKEDEMAEFLVASALGVKNPTNKEYWTLYDILYKGTRIEVKETSYYHPWTKERSRSLHFDIAPRDGSNREEPFCEPGVHRQNDIYVFCIVDGGSFDESYPLNLNAWKFYVVPTTVINNTFPETQKTVSVSFIEKHFTEYMCDYYGIAGRIDMIIKAAE